MSEAIKRDPSINAPRRERVLIDAAKQVGRPIFFSLMTYETQIGAMNERLSFPGISNIWTMPVENRLDMELTGIKTPVGIKVQGPDLGEIQRIGAQIEELLTGAPGTRGRRSSVTAIHDTAIARYLRQRGQTPY